jgi:hypothetical protein
MGNDHVYYSVHVIYVLGKTLMIRAYTSILCALLLYVGVVSIDRYMIITSIEPNTLSEGRNGNVG